MAKFNCYFYHGTGTTLLKPVEVRWSLFHNRPSLCGERYTIEILESEKTYRVIDGNGNQVWDDLYYDIQKYVGDYPEKKAVYVQGKEREFCPTVVLVIKTAQGALHFIPEMF